jgi:hypothetical protein
VHVFVSLFVDVLATVFGICVHLFVGVLWDLGVGVGVGVGCAYACMRVSLNALSRILRLSHLNYRVHLDGRQLCYSFRCCVRRVIKKQDNHAEPNGKVIFTPSF